MNTIQKEVLIHSPVSNVWLYLVDSEKLAAWLMPNDFKPEVGRKFTFTCHTEEDDWDGVIRCQLKELKFERRLRFSWQTNQDNLTTEVTIILEKAGDDTRVILKHSGWDQLPPDREFLFDNYNNGWQNFIMNKLPDTIIN